MKCSIASGSISSQKPAFFSLTLQSRSMIHRKQKYGNDKGAHQLHLWSKRYVVISPNGLQLYKSCSGLCNPWESHHLKQLLQGTWSLLQCPTSVLLPLSLSLPLSLWIPLALFVISLVFSALISILYLVQILSRLSTRASSSCSSSATASMPSAYRRLVVFLPRMLTFPSCSSRASDMIRSRKMNGWKTTSLPYSYCCPEPFSYAAIHPDCTCSLVIELLNGAN